MALSLSKQHTFTSGTTILSAQVNTDFDDLYNAFTGLEGLTKSFSNLLVDSILRSSGTIQSADGTVAAPGLTFTNDTDCGLYRVNTNEVGVAIGGALIGKWTAAGIVMNSLKLSGLIAGTVTGDAVRWDQLVALWGYRRPVLRYVNASTVDVEGGTYSGVSTDVSILFPDGDLRTVTSATLYRFDITRNCVLTGTKQSGLRAALSEVGNTWYALYAVKASDNATDWVTVGDTTLPLAANFATLNSAFGTNSWIYLGLIRNGADGTASTTDILNFLQSGNRTRFLTTNNGGSPGLNAVGIRLADTASATTLTYTYAAGTGNTNIPGNVSFAEFAAIVGASSSSKIVRDSSATRVYHQGDTSNATWLRYVSGAASEGIHLANGAGSSISYDICLGGFVDSALGVGPNPRI